jgi:hypothetical protein
LQLGLGHQTFTILLRVALTPLWLRHIYDHSWHVYEAREVNIFSLRHT